MARQRAPAAAERDIHIIRQPTGQRDVPAAPQLPCAAGEKRGAEVLRQADVQQQRAANGDIRIGGKITIELEREEHTGHNIAHWRRGGVDGVAKQNVDKLCQHVCQPQLFDKAPADQAQPPRKMPGPRGAARAQLREQIARALDRPRDKLREKADEQRVIAQMPFGLTAAAVHVDHIGKRLKGVKADADRQQNIHLEAVRGQARELEQRREIPREKIEIFEKEQQP